MDDRVTLADSGNEPHDFSMGSLLRIVILLAGLWLVIRVVRRALVRPSTDARPDSLPSANMLRCDYCGVFVPHDEVITAHGRHYCSPQHADADSARN